MADRIPARLAAPGDRVELLRSFAQADFDRFAALSGDDNPIHVDASFAAATRFGRTVSHGMLLYAVFAALMRRHGLGAQVWQSLTFPNPAFAGEPLRFSATVAGLDGDAVLVRQRTERLADGATVCVGEARYRREGAS